MTPRKLPLGRVGVPATALLAGTLVAGALIAGAPAAGAATPTWTISKGGAITASAKTLTVTDTTKHLSGHCGKTVFKAKLKSGTRLSGSKAGTVTSLGATGCSVDGFPVTIADGHLPYHLNLVSYNKKTGVTTGTLTGLHLTITLHGPAGITCSAILDGTGAAADNGTVKFSYANKTGKLATLTTGGNTRLYKVSSNCLGIVAAGDKMTLAATFAVSPVQRITSP